MGKHYFKIRYKNKYHNCCFDEDRRIYVLDEKGKTIATSGPISAYSVDLAKDAAQELVESLEKQE